MATTRRKSPASATARRPRKPADPGIVLTGPPGQLRTAVSVENVAEQRVAVRGPALHRSGHEPLTGAGAAVIGPGATARVPVTFSLEAGTPPGEYDAEVEVGGVRRPALLRVEPRPSLSVSPRRLLAGVGRTTVVLTVTNDGNVGMALAPLARARTRWDDGGPGRSRDDAGRDDPGPDVSLSLTQPPTVEPGATVTVEGRLDVPGDLDPTRRHVARLPVGTADLDVTILPRTASE
jgi:hypothetical protein